MLDHKSRLASPQNFFFAAPALFGILVYYTLISIYGERIAAGLAWVNSVSSLFALVNLAVLYSDDETRKSFVSKYFKYVLTLIVVVLCIYILINKSYPALVTLGLNIVFLLLTVRAYTNSKIYNSLLLNISASVFIPITSLSWISEWYALLISILILMFYLKKRTTYVADRTHSDIPLSLLYVLSGLALQAPLILFTFFDVVILKYVSSALFLDYILIWKIINGVLVALFAKRQYILAFSLTEKSITLWRFLTLYASFTAINFILDFDLIGLVVRSCVLSLLINLASIYIRGHTRKEPVLACGLISLALYLILSLFLYLSLAEFLFFSNAMIMYLQYLGSSVIIPILCINYLHPFLRKCITNSNK